MTLPKLNESVKYEMNVPSTGNIITYRPYLVKEEKILLQAFESQDQKMAMRAMVDTVCACVYETVIPDDLKMNVVAAKHPETAILHFVQMYSLLFGFVDAELSRYFA